MSELPAAPTWAADAAADWLVGGTVAVGVGVNVGVLVKAAPPRGVNVGGGVGVSIPKG